MISVEKKRKFDWILFTAVAVLLFIGSLSIMSSVNMLDFKERIVRTHFIAVIIGIAVMIFMWVFDYEILDEYSDKLYILGLILLFLVLIIGVKDKGARSWFRLPFFSVQPSEFARISLLVFLSSYLSKNRNILKDFFGVVKIFLYISPFFILMLKQPDFSGILTTIFPVLILFIVAGINIYYFYFFLIYLILVAVVPVVNVMANISPEILNNGIFRLIYSVSDFNLNTVYVIIAISVLISGLYWVLKKMYMVRESGVFILIFIIITAGYISGIFIKNQIKPYQYKRIESFLYPEKDPLGSGYNIIQAQIAIGSGGFTGKGLFSGTQTRLGFIPERHTDFIISVIGEELGFIGMMIVIICYLVMLVRMKIIAVYSRHIFGYYLSVAFMGLFMGYFLINIGMILGFFPVAGVPLPFVSYGGSNMVASFIIIGILQSIYNRRTVIA